MPKNGSKIPEIMLLKFTATSIAVEPPTQVNITIEDLRRI